MSEDPKSSPKYLMIESASLSDIDEIDLLGLIRILLQAWKIIVGIIIVLLDLVFIMPSMLPRSLRQKPYWHRLERRNQSILNLSQFDGLASMAGVLPL